MLVDRCQNNALHQQDGVSVLAALTQKKKKERERERERERILLERKRVCIQPVLIGKIVTYLLIPKAHNL